MLISIINSYAIKITREEYPDFFNYIFKNKRAGELLSDSENEIQNLNREEQRKILKIKRIILRLSRGLVALFAITIVKLVLIRLIIIGASEILDFIPIFGFIIGGVIQAIVNIPLARKLGKNAKEYCEILVRERIEHVVNNIIEGYKSSVEILNILSKKNDWERKVLVINKI